MVEYSFEIFVLGLTDASKAGRARFAKTMEQLTARPAKDFEASFPSSNEALFRGLDQENAKKVADTLGDAGIFIEIRPRLETSEITGFTSEPPEISDESEYTRSCPACNFVQSADALECQRCGVVFAKVEREQIHKMQKERFLEEALTKALQVREEWRHRARQYLESHPLPEGAADQFEPFLVQDEEPFLVLHSEEGPILMTSRRILALADDTTHSIPYEMISDVDVGGGLVQKKKTVRLQITFHSPLPQSSGDPAKAMSWNLDKDSSFYKDVIMDWAFARNFICGACGERDLDFRTESYEVHARCMHCATDHEIDLQEAVAVPQVQE